MLTKEQYEYLIPLVKLSKEKEPDKRTRPIKTKDDDFQLAELLKERGYVHLLKHLRDNTMFRLEITSQGIQEVEVYERITKSEKASDSRWKKEHCHRVANTVISLVALLLSVLALVCSCS